MKHKNILLTTSLLLLTGCSDKEVKVSPYTKGTSIDEVDDDLTKKGITPLKICDYYFYEYLGRNIVIKKSSDLKRVLKSEASDIPTATEAEFSLIQYGMSPFEVVSLVGLPTSYKFLASEFDKEYVFNVVGMTFQTKDNETKVINFNTYNDYLYYCCEDDEQMYIIDRIYK